MVDFRCWGLTPPPHCLLRPAPGTGSCPATSAAPGASAGMQGASPLASPSLYRKVCWLTGGLRNRNPPGTPYRSRREFWGTGNLPVCSATSGAVVGVPGAKPPANSTKKLPLPQWGRGSGGWGNRLMRSRGKTGEAGRRHPSRHCISQGAPGTPGQDTPGTVSRPVCRAAPGAVQGCRGRSPRQNKLKGSPFPSGEGGRGGDGGEKV